MTADRAEAGPPIVCKVTGRTWPAAHRINLKVCVACGGWIDTRREAWCDGPKHAPCPTPPRPPAPPAPPKVKASTAWDWPRDEAHVAAMAWIQREQLAAANGSPA